MQKRKPASARRHQIVEAALAILNEKGVHRLTAAEIAARVGVSDALLFRHFKNKEAIILAAIDHFEELMFGAFPDDSLAPLPRLEAFFKRRLSLLQEHPSILQLAYSDRLAEAAGEEGAARMQSLVMRSMLFVRGCLSEAQERGQIPADIRPEILVWMLTGAMRGVAGMWQMFPGRKVITLDEAWASVERVLTGKKEKPRRKPSSRAVTKKQKKGTR